MKYMILIYGSQQDYDALGGRPAAGQPGWSPADFAALGAFMEQFNTELAESGELVETRGLTAPAHARRIRFRGGAPVVTDGPYPEAEEVLASYWIVECDSFDRPPRSPPGWPRPPAQRTPATARWWTSGRWLSPGTSWIPDRMAHAEEDLLRRLAPQVLAALVRRYGHFDTAEDAVQEACWRPPRNGPRKAFPATRVAG